MLSNEQNSGCSAAFNPWKVRQAGLEVLHTQLSDVNDPREELHTHFDLERKPSSLGSVFT